MPLTAGKRRFRPLVLALLALVAIPLAYRTLFIYRWRPDVCTTSTAAIVQASAPTDRPGTTVRIATWNIEGHASLISSTHVEAIAKEIVQSDLDVVALQEVHRGTWQARFGDQLTELVSRTGMTAAWSPSYSAAGGFGNAVLTRGTITEATSVRLPVIGEPRSALIAHLRVRGQQLVVVSTHLSAWGRYANDSRSRQLACLTTLEVPPDVIMAGDLNAPPAADEMATIRSAGFIDMDAFAQPTHRVLESKLDYLMHRGGWNVGSVTVEDTDASDHRLLIAEIERLP